MENHPHYSEKEEAMNTGQPSAFPEDMKSIIFKCLGLTDEDMENVLYFVKKVNEETRRKQKESTGVKKSVELENVDMTAVNGNLSLTDYSEKFTDESFKSTDLPLTPLPVLNFDVPKKQRGSKGKPLMGTSGTSFLKKVENPAMGDLETRFSNAKQFKVINKMPNKHRSDRGKTLAINATDFFRKFGTPVLRDCETGSSDAEKVENKRKVQKRCRESDKGEEEKLNKPKRQDGKVQNNKVMKQLAEWGLVPPPNMPTEFKNLIEGMGGSEEKLLIQKIIFKTDLSKSHNRLQIPENQVMATFLTEEEERELDEKGLNVGLIEPCLKKSEIHLTKWNMRNSRVFVFNEQWNSVVDGNQSTIKRNAVVQIWSFRIASKSKLCFAMVKVKDGDDD
ncbi:hypothetical protein SLEP1_g10604 [Rubroshorea leprosula]|uniref:B3 domain-containing protein n=1 Tax=Rubroshorea leprosula TaxID=152421 RepID=A0AAV5IEG4_9ROSI|nr:hypothetical protein SLEP1_g10604 [Rubroshorea leprosula]